MPDFQGDDLLPDDADRREPLTPERVAEAVLRALKQDWTEPYMKFVITIRRGKVGLERRAGQVHDQVFEGEII